MKRRAGWNLLVRVGLGLALMGGSAAVTSCDSGDGGQGSESPDAGNLDTETPDSSTNDSGTQDSGTQDSGTQDSGTQDSGTQDSGAEDSITGGDTVDDVAIPGDDWLESEWAAIVAAAEGMTIADFEATYPLPDTIVAVKHNPLDADWMPEIAAFLQLTDSEEAALAGNGFVAAPLPEVGNFALAYHRIYENDLPVLVTADSMMHAFHMAFDDYVMAVEERALYPLVGDLLDSLHQELGDRVAAKSIPSELEDAAKDLDLYLTVGRSLWADAPATALYSDANASKVTDILALVAALSPGELKLFGVRHENFDFSQFKPRGHYVDNPILEKYFRTLMWLGRTEMRMVGFTEQGDPILYREGIRAAALITDMLDSASLTGDWQRIEDLLAGLIGRRDSAGPPELQHFFTTEQFQSPEDLEKLDDQALTEAILATTLGEQAIMSEIVLKQDLTAPTLKLSRIFLLLGQRYAIDSEVLSKVVFDRLLDENGATAKRMLPSVGDVLFALGNNWARTLLGDDLEKFRHQKAMHLVRSAVDARPEAAWGETVYDAWLATIAESGRVPTDGFVPDAMKTDAWQDKMMNAGATSWAELRRDTILYVKQSYSTGIGCVYPDAYLEPVPHVYKALQRGVVRLRALADETEAAGLGTFSLSARLDHWESVLAKLVAIAETELAGEPLKAEQSDFLRAAIEIEMQGCGENSYDGWYAQLADTLGSTQYPHPIIADVHTAPTDEFGTPKGWVQHVATGPAAALVLTVESCDGEGPATAYVGPIRGLYTPLQENFERLTDLEWEDMLQDGTAPAMPAWTQSFWPGE